MFLDITRNPRSLKTRTADCPTMQRNCFSTVELVSSYLKRSMTLDFHYYQEETENVTDPIKAVKLKGSCMLTADLVKHRFITAAHLRRHVLLALI